MAPVKNDLTPRMPHLSMGENFEIVIDVTMTRLIPGDRSDDTILNIYTG